MSITKIRNQFAACGMVAAAVLGVALILGLVMVGGRSGPGAALEQLGPVAFKIGGVPIHQVTVDTGARAAQMSLIEQKRQDPNTPEELGPDDLVSSYSRALDTAVSQGALLALAKQEGIKTGIDEIEEWIPQSAEDLIQQQVAQAVQGRDFYVMMAQMEADGAKEKSGENSDEYKRALMKANNLKTLPEAKFFEEVSGRSIEDLRAQILELYEASAREPGQIQGLQAQMASERLLKKIQATIDTSDEATKRSYEKFTFQQIYFEATKTANPEAKAREVLQKIRDGMEFTAAMDEFTDLRPQDPEEKPSANADQTQDRLQIEAAGTYTAILDLKPGEVSEVITLPTGASIYKMIKVEPGVPDDFATQRTKRAADMKNLLSTSRMVDRITEFRKTAEIEWESQAYRLLYDYDQVMQPTGTRYEEFAGAENQQKRVEALMEIFQQLRETEADTPDLVACLRFVCFNQIDALTPAGPEKDRLNEERLQVYSDVANIIASPTFKFEYVSVLLAAEMGDEALLQLLEIATNATIYDPLTFPNVEKVEQLLPVVAKLAQPNSPTIAQIQAELELAKQNAQEAKQLEEEERKAQEEAEKAIGDQDGTPAPPEPPPGG